MPTALPTGNFGESAQLAAKMAVTGIIAGHSRSASSYYTATKRLRRSIASCRDLDGQTYPLIRARLLGFLDMLKVILTAIGDLQMVARFARAAPHRDHHCREISSVRANLRAARVRRSSKLEKRVSRAPARRATSAKEAR